MCLAPNTRCRRGYGGHAGGPGALPVHHCQSFRVRYRVVTESRGGGTARVPDHPGSVVRRSLQLTLFAVVLVGLVGGCFAYFAAQKSITRTVDGEDREVHTHAAPVGEVLEDEGLEPAAHDVLLPGADAQVADGDAV